MGKIHKNLRDYSKKETQLNMILGRGQKCQKEFLATWKKKEKYTAVTGPILC